MTTITDKLMLKVVGEPEREKPDVRFEDEAKRTGMARIEAPADGESRRQTNSMSVGKGEDVI